MKLDFVALDFETATPKRCSVCQIGMVRVRRGEIVDEFSSLICPPDNEYSYWNQRIHGLGSDDTLDAPCFLDLWPQIANFIGNDPVVAHNVGFDRSCLRKCWEAFEIEPMEYVYDCTYRKTGLSLDKACEHYGVVLDNHHDALADAIACARIYVALARASVLV